MTSAPRLIALDWGTSSLRALLLGAGGVVLDSRAVPFGIMHVPPGGFRTVFAEIAGDWLRVTPGLPAVTCGMIGSAQGWRQAPYCQGPTGLRELAAGLVTVPGDGTALRIVPSIAMQTPRPEVMHARKRRSSAPCSCTRRCRPGRGW